MMMTSGLLVVGVLFCLFGSVVLAAIAVVGLRWFLDQGRRKTTHTAHGSFGSPVADHFEQ
jgi:hypothetical protein